MSKLSRGMRACSRSCWCVPLPLPPPHSQQHTHTHTAPSPAPVITPQPPPTCQLPELAVVTRRHGMPAAHAVRKESARLLPAAKLVQHGAATCQAPAAGMGRLAGMASNSALLWKPQGLGSACLAGYMPGSLFSSTARWPCSVFKRLLPGTCRCMPPPPTQLSPLTSAPAAPSPPAAAAPPAAPRTSAAGGGAAAAAPPQARLGRAGARRCPHQCPALGLGLGQGLVMSCFSAASQFTKP
jgi:hypothetical protein